MYVCLPGIVIIELIILEVFPNFNCLQMPYRQSLYIFEFPTFRGDAGGMLQIINNMLQIVKDSFGPVLDIPAWWPEDLASFYYAKLIPIYYLIPLLLVRCSHHHTGARAVKEYSGYIINRRVMHKNKQHFLLPDFYLAFQWAYVNLFIEN